MKRIQILPVLFSALALTACGAGSESASSSSSGSSNFDFSTMDNSEAVIHVTRDGVPASGAVVTISDTLRVDPGEYQNIVSSGRSHATIRANDDGTARVDLRLPLATSEVDVIVTYPDSEGPYTDPQLREAWGFFAPAARVRVARQNLGNVHIALQEVTQ